MKDILRSFRAVIILLGEILVLFSFVMAVTNTPGGDWRKFAIYAAAMVFSGILVLIAAIILSNQE